MQPTPDVTSADVKRIVARDFPTEQTGDVEAILNEYGTSQSERELARVRLAVLKLAGGSMDRLCSQIEAAKEDYRDVLAAAEYPEYCRVSESAASLSPEDKQRIVSADWTQYCEWLRR